jgi:multiple sugar transport system substrate-binding protein
MSTAACGVGAPAAPSTSSTSSAPGTARIAPGTRVQFYGTANDSIFASTRAAATAPVIQQWQEKTGITIDNVELGGANYNDRLQVLIAGETAPDVVGVGGSADPLGALLLAGAIWQLDTYVKRDRYDLSDYYPNSMSQYRHRNALWALPMDSNPSAMFVNRDLLAQAGVPLPPSSWKAANWTWNDLLAAARSLTKPGASPEQTVFGAAVADNLKTPSIAVWGYGGELFDKELTKSALDSPRAIEALQFMADLVVKHNVNPAPRQLQGTNVGALFGAGRIGLLAQGQQLGYTRTLGAAPPAFSWSVAALPKGPAGRFALNIGTAYALTKGSKQPEAGWEVLKFISSPDFSRAYMGDGLAAIAPRRAVMADVLKSPSLPFGYKEVVDYADSLRPMPTVARWVEVSSAISKHFARLWTGDASVNQVVSDLSTEVKPLLEPRL